MLFLDQIFQLKNYIKFLKQAKNGDKAAEEKYKWTMIEIFDQMVRNYSGGEMLEYWKQNPMPQEEFVISRVGSEVLNTLNLIRSNTDIKPIKNNINQTAKTIGEFRISGEIHQWMYDEYSLGKLLKETGFNEIKRKQFNQSQIETFNNYLLDMEKDGGIRKPDSLFMEAIK